MYSKKLSGTTLSPLTLLFGVVFSIFYIKFYFLLIISISICLGYMSLKMYNIFPRDIFLCFISLFLYALLLKIFVNQGIDSTYHILILLFSITLLFSMTFFGYYNSIRKLNYLFLFYLILVLIVSLLEIYCGLILPSSVKADLQVTSYYDKSIPTGFFYNQNDFAAVVAMIFIYSFSYFNILKKKIAWIILVISMLIVVFTGSRGVVLAILFYPLAYCLVQKKKLISIFLIYIILMFFLGFILFYSLNFSSSESLLYITAKKIIRGFNVIKGSGDSSFFTRFLIIQYTFNNFYDVIIGYGPGGAEAFLSNSNPFGIINAHNFFLEILINYGIFGLLISIYIYSCSYKILTKISKSKCSKSLKASANATKILILLFIFISVVPSSLLKDWAFSWFPITLTFATYGRFRREIEIV